MSSIMVIPLIAFGLAIAILWYELHSLRKRVALEAEEQRLRIRELKMNLRYKANADQVARLEQLLTTTKQSHEALLEHLKLQQTEMPAAILFVKKEN